ncbi:aldolase/citrate lyase family protein [Burkholderia gladioli]|nr:aldolase/citrate lyase family protein [Burkholderia gladioli]
MKQLDLDVLEMVVAIADTGSFVRAAEAVHRSSSALSMQIRTLEEALGKPLFARSTRKLSITHEGRTIVDYGRRMLAMREEAWASVVRPEVRGRVTIGVPDDYVSTLLPSVLRKFAIAHPRVEIRVIGLPSSALVPLIKDNTVDLACMTRTRGVSAEFIRHEPVVWAALPDNRPIWEERPLPIAVFGHASAARARAVGFWVSMAEPYLAEITATAGFDWLLIDGEHAPNDVRSIVAQLQAVAPYRAEAVVRPGEGRTAVV